MWAISRQRNSGRSGYDLGGDRTCIVYDFCGCTAEALSGDSGADSMPFAYVMGYLALLKGIFYYEDALEQILNRKISEADILQAEENLMELGFEGDIYGEKADAYLKNIFAIAREHLEGNEESFLDVLEQIVEEKKEFDRLL